MPYNPARHHRRSIRLAGHDYTQPGAYYVTLVALERGCCFGEVVNGVVRHSDCGQLVARCWCALPRLHPQVTLDTWVLMPNHLHGIIVLPGKGEEGGNSGPDSEQVGLPLSLPLRPHGTRPGSLAALVQAFKAETTRRVNRIRGTAGGGRTLWQRDYYEHIIRNERDEQAIRQYILDNPANWALDSENPLVAR